MLQTKQKSLQIIPLGGLEEVGRNALVLRWGSDIILIDLGLQFPEEDMPGIDYIIPNIDWLRDKTKMIRGIIITHGHYDHIGAIPHLLEDLGNPPIYASALSQGIILKRYEDFPKAKPPFIKTVKAGDKINLGAFRVEFLHVNHNIPDSFGLIIETPVGRLIHSGDFKFDQSPLLEEPADIGRLAQIGKKGVLCLLSDSTSVEEEGFSTSETEIKQNLEEIFKLHKNQRIIVATFASLITRIQQIFDLAQKYGRKVAVDGYSMKGNVEIARNLGYLRAPSQLLISIKEIPKTAPSRVVVLCTGAQGEGNAVLMRIAQKDHPFIKIRSGDVVVFSSSVVPGNERTVQALKDVLARQGAKVLHYQMMDIHAGGHAKREDLKMMINLTKPKFFIPIHGHYYMLKLHAELAQKLGIPPKNIKILSNGQIVNLTPEKIWLSSQEVPSHYVMVDGLGVGDVGEIVLRDRQKMAEDGMFVIIVKIDSKTGQPQEPVDIISRGFVYLNESKELLEQAREKVCQIVQKTAASQHALNWAYIKDNLRDRIGDFLYQKTHRRPLILPVVMEV